MPRDIRMPGAIFTMLTCSKPLPNVTGIRTSFLMSHTRCLIRSMRYEYVLQHNKITACQYRLYRSALVCLWAMLKSNRCTHRCIYYPLSVHIPVQIRMHLTMHRLQTSTNVHKCLSAKEKTNELRGRVVGPLP